MGRTLPSVTQQLQVEEDAFKPFRRVLRKTDQVIFDELFVAAKNHRAAVSLASRALPMEAMIIAMLIEQRKEILHLRTLIIDLQAQVEK